MLACPQLFNPFIGIVHIGHGGSADRRDRRWVFVDIQQKNVKGKERPMSQ